MAPFIRDGDVITISPLQHTLPGLGDVVAFVRHPVGNLVVHRVVARHAKTWFIQGDNEPECADGIIPVEDLLGRVTRIERDGRDMWLGLGPERFLIAWLSRTRRLIPLRDRFSGWLKPFVGWCA